MPGDLKSGVRRESRQMKVAVTILVFCVAALLALGMVMLYSSSMAQVGAHYLMMQFVWCVLGLAAAWWRRWWITNGSKSSGGCCLARRS